MQDSTVVGIDIEQVLQIFEELTIISGTSLNERKVADYISSFTKELPYLLIEDKAGKKIGGDTGNLIFVPHSYQATAPTTAFLAHMDTVRDTGKTVTERTNDRIKSSTNTQLGADNRLGVALLLWFMEHISRLDIQPNILFVFTIAEEIGLLGAKELDLAPWSVSQAYVLDSSLRPGKFIADCYGCCIFEARFNGKAAHSAVSNGNGINAISMAVEAVSTILSTPIPEGFKRNIGKIKGGEATNIIPDSCHIEGEVRGVSSADMNSILAEYKKICGIIAGEKNGSVTWNDYADFEGYTIPESSSLRNILESSLLESGLTPEGVTYTGGSDANALNAKGIKAINLGIGAQNPHSDDEFVLFEDIHSMMKLLIALQHNLI